MLVLSSLGGLAVLPVLLDSQDPFPTTYTRLMVVATAAFSVLTAIAGRCLIYRALDVNTCDHGGTYHSGEDPYDGRGGD